MTPEGARPSAEPDAERGRVRAAATRTPGPAHPVGATAGRGVPQFRPRAGGPALGPSSVVQLQRLAGNAAVRGLLGPEPPGQTSSGTDALPPVASPAASAVPPPVRLDRVPAEAHEAGSGTDDGVLAGLRRRIGTWTAGLTSGWEEVRGTVGAGVSRVSDSGQGALTQVSALAGEAASAARGAWGTARGAVTGLQVAAQQRIAGLVGEVYAAFPQVRAAITGLDADGLAGAWERVAGVLGGAAAGAGAGLAALRTGLAGAWNGLQTQFAAGLARARVAAAAITDGISGAARAVTEGASAAWAGVAARAAEIPGVSGAARLLMDLVRPLLAAATSTWGSVQRRWAELRERTAELRGRLVGSLERGWQRASAAAGSVFDGVRGLWDRARDGAVGAVQRLASGARSAWQQVRGFSIGGVVTKLRKYSTVVRRAEELIEDPESVMVPYATPIAGQLTGGMPAAAGTAAQQHAPQLAGTAPDLTAASGGAGSPVQRLVPQGAGPAVLRSTSSGAEVWAGLKAAFTEKWRQLDVRKMVVDALISIVWPWPKIGTEIVGVGHDVAAAAGSLFMPRNLFADPWGALHDIYSDAMKILDIPVVIFRRLNNIALLLLGPITIALTVIGAIGGSFAGTVLGAVAGALFGAGVGAAPGSGAGLAVGGTAGAGAGFGVAMTVGEAFLISFVAGEATALVKGVADLFTTLQTREEKADDYGTIADSSLALGITAVLVGLGWIGGRVAGAAAAFLRRFAPESVLAVIDRFAKGVRAGRGGEPEPVEKPTPVPGKTELLTDLAGSRSFAGKLRTLLDTIQRPGARPALETRLQTIEDRLVRLSTETDAATTSTEVERIRAEREAAQQELQRLNTDLRAAQSRFPASWNDFDPDLNAEFETELNAFRGNSDLDPNPGLRGGEGQLFLGRNPVQALKRWFTARIGDMAESLRLLRSAKAAVNGNARLSAVMDVVEVGASGGDWAIRGFDPSSVPLRSALGDPEVAAARTEALAALEGVTDGTSVSIRSKLASNSANLHWSPSRRRILVIDMQ